MIVKPKRYQPRACSTMPNADARYVGGTADDRVTRMRRGLAVATSFVAVAATCVAACNDAKTHVYSARAYDVGADCLSDYAALDVVAGETGSARCAAVCLVSGGNYFASTMCAPYPSAFDVFAADAGVDAATDPACTAVLAASAANRACGAPPDAGDAGDGEAGDDGGGDDGGGDDGATDAPTDVGPG